jgi:N-acetylmuramoyl-L-alanine amidase
MRIVISSGHGAKIAGAAGFIQEVPEARRVVERTAAVLRELGAAPIVFHENNATTQASNVSAIIAFHNGQTRDLDVSVHFNHSGQGNVDRAIGTEVIHATQKDLATRVSRAMADSGGFINRGAKSLTDLGRTLSFLTKTAKPAILLEVCFVNSREDTRLYEANFEPICLAIATSIIARAAPSAPSVPTPTEAVVTVFVPKGIKIEVKNI